MRTYHCGSAKGTVDPNGLNWLVAIVAARRCSSELDRVYGHRLQWNRIKWGNNCPILIMIY